MGIYTELVESVRNGCRFRADFAGRNLTLNDRYLIKEGKAEGEIDIPDVPDPYAEVQRLYDIYRYSVPTGRSRKKGRQYFPAEAEEKLTVQQMCNGEEREVARAMLEGYVLCAVISGKLTWADSSRYYWHGTDGLIIFREWISGDAC